MSKVTILPPSQNFVETIASLCISSGFDYSGNAVIFPGKRPAHVLRKTLADSLQTSFIPPRIFSIDEFIEHLVSEFPGEGRKKIEPADALSLLYDIHSRAGQKIGEDHYRTLDAFIPLGMKLLGELEEIAMTEFSSGKIRDILSGIPFTKIHALYEYYEKFYQAVEQKGFVTRSVMYRTVAERLEEVDFGKYSQVIIGGFFAFTNVEKTIISGFNTCENVHLIFQHGKGLKERLAGLSLVVEMTEPENQPEPQYHFIAAPDLHGQIFALASQVKNRIDEMKPMDHRVGIILPSSDALFPLYHHVLSLLSPEQYNITLGYPVVRTPAFGFLMSLIALADSELDGTYSSGEYIRFLLHPYTKNIRLKTRSDVTRIIVHGIEEYLAERGALQVDLKAIEEDNELLEGIHKGVSAIDKKITLQQLRDHLTIIHDNTIRKFHKFTSINDCMQRAKEALLYIFSASTASLHPYFRPYVERLIEALDGIANSLLAEKYFTEPTGYFSFIRNMLNPETVPFSGTPLNGIQALGLLETRNLSFETLYILDMNDDIVPGKPVADLLLHQQVRERLGLETYRQREDLIEYYVSLAIAGAKEVFFHYSKSESGKKEKSRFIEKLLWQQQQKEKILAIEKYEESAKYRVQLANTLPIPVAKTEAMVARMRATLRYSANSLDMYNVCGLKFYYRYVLRLRDKAEADDDLDEASIGRIVHMVLYDLFLPFIGKQLKKEDLTNDRLSSVIDDCFQKQFGDTVTGEVMLIKTQVHEHLRQFLEEYQFPLLDRSPVLIKELEQSIQVEKSGYMFTGRIDRIEMRGEQIYILDYKTKSDGKNLRIKLEKLDPDDSSTWREAIQSFQLPLYMLLYNEMTKRGIENITPAYLFLGKKTIDENIEEGIENEENDAAIVYNRVEPVIFNMIEEVLSLDHAFTPTSELEKHCPFCPYSVICGTQWAGSR